MDKNKIEAGDIGSKNKSGHRERLKMRFIAGEENAHVEEALLELLLTYAIPQKDVRPLAEKLLTAFGSLANVLSADIETLCKQDGIKEHAATLLKLTDWIRKYDVREDVTQIQTKNLSPQLPLFPDTVSDNIQSDPKMSSKKDPSPPAKSGLFGKAMLQEAIDMLPQLPDTESLPEIRDFLKAHLPFSGQTTRTRNTQYIVRRMFPEGFADKALRGFAQNYAGKQELKSVCFYRFCKAEPLMFDIIEKLLLPAIGAGQIERSAIRDYLSHRFPAYASTGDCTQAIIEALIEGGIATADRLTLYFSYHEILLAAFAFILHSEFPEPGMFDIKKIEQNHAIRAMFWQPDDILPMLYEMRNRKMISKVSEIDNIRQFTIKYTLDRLSKML